LIWTAIALLTVVVTSANLRAARRSMRTFRNGAVRTLIADGDVRREAFRLIVAVLFLYAGAASLFRPTLMALGPIGEMVVSLSVPALVVSSALIGINSESDRRDRNRLTKLMGPG
jgi:hypothetical protein